MWHLRQTCGLGTQATNSLHSTPAFPAQLSSASSRVSRSQHQSRDSPGRCSSTSLSSGTPCNSVPCSRRRAHIAMSAAAAAAPTATPSSAAAPYTPRTGKPTRTDIITSDPANNVSDYIFEKIGADLHRRHGHPICTIKSAIQEYFETRNPGVFRFFDDLYPVVSTVANFDEMLVPPDHVSRSPNDTYYVDPNTVLRCHTSAHQAQMLRAGVPAFLLTGDVYRRDSIDATHYPVFHQMEGVRVFSPEEWAAAGVEATALAERDLKDVLEGLARHLFGQVECRWIDAYFPFTNPSFELEIMYNGKWLEVLGCGVMQQSILDANYGPGHKAWAFGLGLERLAMVLFDVPDIRLFWSDDERFTRQFRANDLKARFKPYSKFPPCYKDMAFWVSPEFSENNLCELVRGIGGDLVEEVTLIDKFDNKKTGRTSNCFRITYRSMERSLTDEEINALQDQVRKQTADVLKVELR